MAVQLVNIIPRTRSGETQQDSEPNLAVNPANPQQIVASAFTFDSSGGPNRAPIYVSNDGGSTWLLSRVVPSPGQTLDISLAFSNRGNTLYAGIIPNDPPDPTGEIRPRINILRTSNPLGPNPMEILVDRRGAGVDQPYVEATAPRSGPNVGKDAVFVANNDFGQPGRRTATIDYSIDAAAAAASFRRVTIDSRSPGPNGQDAPSIRPAVHPDGTVYGGVLAQNGLTPDPLRG